MRDRAFARRSHELLYKSNHRSNLVTNEGFARWRMSSQRESDSDASSNSTNATKRTRLKQSRNSQAFKTPSHHQVQAQSLPPIACLQHPQPQCLAKQSASLCCRWRSCAHCRRCLHRPRLAETRAADRARTPAEIARVHETEHVDEELTEDEAGISRLPPREFGRCFALSL